MAHHCPGMCYEHGFGVAADKKGADKWYALAIESGYGGKK